MKPIFRTAAAILLILVFMLSGVTPIYPVSAESNAVRIEDPVLEKAIRDQLKLDDKDILDYQAILKLESLYPRGEGKIKSLKGLENAWNLKQLYLTSQDITDITPLSGLYQLDFLALNGNRIQDACPISGLTGLRKLVLFHNEIEDIGCLSHLTKLTDLLLSNNHIRDISPLSKLPIGWLDVSHNPISDVTPAASMKKLHHLYVDAAPLNEESKLLLDRFAQSGIAVNRAAAASGGISGITVMVKGDRILFDQAPKQAEGTTLVQFRPLFEKLGFQVRWEDETRTILAEKEGTTLSLQLDNLEAVLNGKRVLLPAAPVRSGDSIMVPVRFVGEAIQYEVTWESSSKTIYLMPDREETARDGASKITLNGKWLIKPNPSDQDQMQLYAVNGGNMLVVITETKDSMPDHIRSLQDYEGAIQKVLGDKVTEFSNGRTLQVNGLNARQFTYVYSPSEGKSKFLYVQTMIEGTYNYYRVILVCRGESDSKTVQEYADMLNTFQEIKTPAQLSQEKFGSMKPEERLLDAAHYYRKLGYFGQDRNLTDQQFDEKFLKFYKDFVDSDWNPFDSSEYYDEYAELYVWGEDKDRVWLKDTEADVVNGNDVYVKTLQQWSALSRGAFKPEDIKESWGSDEGPVTVTFTLNGQKRTLHPRFMNDFIDTGILLEINEMIRDSGIQFVMVEIDQTVFVTALTAEEKSRIEQDRHLAFDELE